MAERTPAERLVAVYYELAGNGTRAVRHTAAMDGWVLRASSSDFGDVVISAKRGVGDELEVIGFELLPDDSWAPVYRGTEDKHLGWLADLAEKAEWSRA